MKIISVISKLIKKTGKGTVYSWGDGTRGQLGLGDTEIKYKPTLISFLSEIKKVFCCKYLSLASTSKFFHF